MPANDLSDKIAFIEVALQALAMRWVQGRLLAYQQTVEARAGKKFGNWRMLPDEALESLEKKLKTELDGE